MDDTIFALSSGAPPAAIGIIRVSGPCAGATLKALTGRDIDPRRPSLAVLRDSSGTTLDQALVLWFPGPETATGEDLAELHCHGGRAVISAVEAALGALEGLRKAEPGEFTRRAFANGRIDLSEAEGLADLLSAETELQRRSAIAMAGGSFSQQVEDWRSRVLALSAEVEGVLDFSDEEDSSDLPEDFRIRVHDLSRELEDWLSRPRAERLGEGFRVILSGPPNTGKSTLFNILVDSDAAITSPIAGTTRDVIERSVALGGIPFTFVDTAGLREDGDDPIEAIGVARARDVASKADLVLWLGEEGGGPVGAWEIEPKCDEGGSTKSDPRHRVSAMTLNGVEALKADLISAARGVMPKPGELALNARQHGLVADAHAAISAIVEHSDALIVGEGLRSARVAFDRLIGRSTTEDMLDVLFGRFCVGK